MPPSPTVSTVEDPALAAALSAARRAIELPPMPPAALAVRVKTSPWLRRYVPTRVVVRRAQARGQALWERHPAEGRRALAAMEAVVGATVRAGEIHELARQHIIEAEVHTELFWQPWKTARMDAESRGHAQAAFATGRGVLLSSCHLGPIFGYRSAITRLAKSTGKSTYAVAAPWFFEDPSPGYWGRRIARWRSKLEEHDERVVCSVGSFPVLRALLGQGEVVVIYFDMPGSRSTRFLGKPVMLASGSARLAFLTDSVVLPVRARRVDDRVWADVRPPLDPRDFSGHEHLHDALAAVHERSILELPATLEDPRRAGAWEEGATAQAWTRPGPSPPSGRAEALSLGDPRSSTDCRFSNAPTPAATESPPSGNAPDRQRLP